MTNNTVKILYVDDAGMVTFICPKCGDALNQSVEKFRGHIGSISMSCICGNAAEVKLEFRKFFRKETALEGLYFRTAPEGHWGKMIVNNLSILGCRFEMFKKDPLVQGEEIKIQFTLDNRRGSIIRRKAVIVAVEGRSVRCKFCEPPGYIDSELGFYLRKS